MFLYIILKGSSLRFQRAQEHRKRSPDENLFAFSALEILSVHLEIGSTPPMCDISSIFVTLNISTFCSKALVVTFPTPLVSSHLEFICKSYRCSGRAEILPAVVPSERAVVPLALGWEASAAVPLPVPPIHGFGCNVRYWQGHCRR